MAWYLPRSCTNESTAPAADLVVPRRDAEWSARQYQSAAVMIIMMERQRMSTVLSGNHTPDCEQM